MIWIHRESYYYPYVQFSEILNTIFRLICYYQYHQVSPTYKILYNCFSNITRSYWINSTLTQSRCVALLSLIYIFLFLSQILCTYILLRSLWKGICLYFVIKLDRLKFSQLIILYWPKLWKIYICFVIK